MEKAIAYKQFENSVLKDFSDILIEDGIRGGKSKTEAQKQAKRFTARLSAKSNDMMMEVYREYNVGKVSLESAQEEAFQYIVLNFCKENNLTEEAAEYFLVMHEEMWEEKNGCFSFPHFAENALSYFLQAVCLYIHEKMPDQSSEAVREEASRATQVAQTDEVSILNAFYNEYRLGKITLVAATDNTLKALLSSYLQKNEEKPEKLEHIISLLQQSY